MHDFTRRRFLQAASLLAAGGYGHNVLVKRSQAAEDAATAPAAVPAFAEKPTFDPSALFLTWQRDPTTTMTVQWVGEEKDAATRPIWFAKEGTKEWKSQTWSSRKFPLTDLMIFRTELTRLEPGTDYRFRVG